MSESVRERERDSDRDRDRDAKRWTRPVADRKIDEQIGGQPSAKERSQRRGDTNSEIDMD